MNTSHACCSWIFSSVSSLMFVKVAGFNEGFPTLLITLSFSLFEQRAEAFSTVLKQKGLFCLWTFSQMQRALNPSGIFHIAYTDSSDSSVSSFRVWSYLLWQSQRLITVFTNIRLLSNVSSFTHLKGTWRAEDFLTLLTCIIHAYLHTELDKPQAPPGLTLLTLRLSPLMY